VAAARSLPYSRSAHGPEQPTRHDPEVAISPRLLFYAHDHFGVGHLRRLLHLAEEIARCRPDATMLLVAGGPIEDGFPRPATLDTIALPSIKRAAVYRGLPGLAPTRAPEPGLVAMRSALIREAARTFAPHLVLVEFLPSGYWGELRPMLADVAARPDRPALVLGLRDVLAPPAELRRSWHQARHYELLERVYDRVLVYGMPEVFDTVREYDFPPAVAAKTTYCGFVTAPPAAVSSEPLRERLGAGPDRALVVVTTGGGTHGAPLLRAYLEACRRGLLPDVSSFLTLGPRLGSGERDRLTAAAAGLPGVTAVPFVRDLPGHLAAADLVVTAAGYNATVESLQLGKRLLLVPRAEPDREQVVRAERLAELRLARLLRPEALGPETVAAEVRAALAEPPPTVSLDFGGRTRAAGLLAALLPPAD
jgi:predicted glycosyltransferase